MGRTQKLLHETRVIALTGLYSGCWPAALLALKQLILAEYRVEYGGMSKAVIGALVRSRGVFMLEHVPLVGPQPAGLGGCPAADEPAEPGVPKRVHRRGSFVVR